MGLESEAPCTESVGAGLGCTSSRSESRHAVAALVVVIVGEGDVIQRETAQRQLDVFEHGDAAGVLLVAEAGVEVAEQVVCDELVGTRRAQRFLVVDDVTHGRQFDREAFAKQRCGRLIRPFESSVTWTSVIGAREGNVAECRKIDLDSGNLGVDGAQLFEFLLNRVRQPGLLSGRDSSDDSFDAVSFGGFDGTLDTQGVRVGNL